MSIRIVTDSTCDLPLESVERYGITVIPAYLNMGGQSYRDGIDIGLDEFYRRLPDCDPPPTTATPGPGVFAEAYKRLAAEGATSIVSLHVSSNLSNMCQTARLAAQDSPPVPVKVIDSGNLSLALGLAAVAAADKAREGAALEEIEALLVRLARRSYSFALLDSLEYVRRSGRVSHLMARLASLVHIKPLIGFSNGDLSVDRVRTLKAATSRLLDKLLRLGPLSRLTILHTNDAERAEALRQSAFERLPAGSPLPDIVRVGAVLGIHLGPQTVGFTALTERDAEPLHSL